MCKTGTPRKPELPQPCWSIVPLDNYININPCNGNDQSPSRVQGKDHASSCCQVLFQCFLWLLDMEKWAK